MSGAETGAERDKKLSERERSGELASQKSEERELSAEREVAERQRSGERGKISCSSLIIILVLRQVVVIFSQVEVNHSHCNHYSKSIFIMHFLRLMTACMDITRPLQRQNRPPLVSIIDPLHYRTECSMGALLFCKWHGP